MLPLNTRKHCIKFIFGASRAQTDMSLLMTFTKVVEGEKETVPQLPAWTYFILNAFPVE